MNWYSWLWYIQWEDSRQELKVLALPGCWDFPWEEKLRPRGLWSRGWARQGEQTIYKAVYKGMKRQGGGGRERGEPGNWFVDNYQCSAWGFELHAVCVVPATHPSWALALNKVFWEEAVLTRCHHDGNVYCSAVFCTRSRRAFSSHPAKPMLEGYQLGRLMLAWCSGAIDTDSRVLERSP